MNLKFLKLALCLIILLGTPTALHAQNTAGPVPSISREKVAQALEMVLLHPDEVRLKLARRGQDSIRLPIVNRTFEAPLSAATEAQVLCDKLWEGKSLLTHMQVAGDVLNLTGFQQLPLKELNEWSDLYKSDFVSGLRLKKPEGVSDKHWSVIQQLLRYLNPEPLRNADTGLTLSERRELADLLPDLLDRDTDSAVAPTFEALITNPQLERATELLFKTDLRPYFYAAMVLQNNFDRMLPTLMTDLTGPASPVKYSTPHGCIWIGTTGDDIYSATEPPLLILDPGGNDIYKLTQSASGMLSLIVDIAGDDIYQGKGAFTVAGALDGVSMLVDLAGNDHYLAERYGLGASCLGVGVLYDRAGIDLYEGDSICAGAAMAGAGILLDNNGNDRYLCQVYSEGFGGAAGFGALVDLNGFDLYQTGTKHGDSVGRNPPGYVSMSQGCGYGIRSYASGGVGVLADRKGNDTYYGGYFCQGTSYWYALGVLGDREGDDVYISQRYSQGSGVHLTTAVLWDQAGDDRYQTWGVGIGCGHDLAVGLFYEGGGNDSYTTEWLTMGVGNTNGIGIFYEAAGNDAYQIKNTHNKAIHLGWGDYFKRRRQQSIGLFLDLGGEDIYSGVGGQERVWLNGDFGVGLDVEGAK
jgi:hypothetical protein